MYIQIATFKCSSKQLKMCYFTINYMYVDTHNCWQFELKLLHQQVTERSFEMYGSHVDCDMKSSDIKVMFLKTADGWVVEGLHTQVKCLYI